MSLEKNLRDETEKWLAELKLERMKIELKDNSKENVLKNMDAYTSDAQHFLQKGDLIKAFEAVIWSWAILELGLELGVLGKRP